MAGIGKTTEAQARAESGLWRMVTVEGQTVETLWMLAWAGVVFVAHFSVLAIWVSWR